MSHVPHELRDDFPDYADRITALKTEDEAFRQLADEYHLINREIHRIEAGVEATADTVEEELRKKRLALKDEIYTRLKAA